MLTGTGCALLSAHVLSRWCSFGVFHGSEFPIHSVSVYFFSLEERGASEGGVNRGGDLGGVVVVCMRRCPRAVCLQPSSGG